MNETTAPSNHRPGRIGRQTAPWSRPFSIAAKLAAEDAAKRLAHLYRAGSVLTTPEVAVYENVVQITDAATGRITRLTVTAEVL